jgi:sigma-E factor negative regulatory protein RseB
MNRARSSRFTWLGLFLLFVGQSHAADDSTEWLERMGQAVDTLNYRGVLVHMYSGEADVSQIVHRVAEGIVTERVTAMDETGREIIRNNGKVTCIFPDRKVIMVEHQMDADTTPGVGQFPKFRDLDQASYSVEMIGAARAVGREAVILSVMPMDSYRYGYRLWLDRDTAMLLKSQLLSERGSVVEEFMFTDISFADSIPVADAQSSIDVDSFTWERPEPAMNIQVRLDAALWSATDLPAGFALAAVRSKQGSDGKDPMEQLVYSDGLASVSVFVEVGVAASEQAEGPSQVGAANAYTTTLDGRLITAVGDVPERTATMIAKSVQPASDR